MAILSNINDKFAVDSTGAIQFNGQAGTSGYILKSNGNAAPTWVAASTVIGGPYLPLTGGTLTGATATASGISFTVGGNLTVGDDINISGEQLTFTNDSASAYIRAADALLIQSDWNTGENKPIYLQPSAVTELTIATGASTFAGNVTLSSTAPVLYLANTTSTTGKTWRFSSAANGKAYITQDGVIDAITLSHTTGNATFSGNATFAGNVISLDTFYLQNSSGKRWQQLFDGNNWNIRYYNGSSWSADALSLDTSNNATFAGTISTVGASTFNLGEGVFIKAVNTSNAITSSNVWGYGLYEGASRIGEFSMVRDGSSSVYIGTSYSGQKLILGTAAKVTALTIDASQNSTFAGTIVSDNIAVGLSDGNDSSISLTANTGNWTFTNVQSNRKLEISDSDGTGTVMTIDTSGKVGIGTNGPVRQLDVAGITKTNGLQIKRNYIEQQADCAFANGVANQNIDIRLGNISFWGYIEVEITGTYSNQNTPGKLTKVYAVGVNPNGTIYANNPRVVDALGPIKNNIALGAFSWDSTNSTYRIRVSHIVSTGNNYTIKLKAFTHGSNGTTGAAGILSNFTLSTVYTATSLSQNYVYYDNAVGIGTDLPQSKFQVAYQGNANGGTILMGAGGSGVGKWSTLAGTHYNQASGSGNGSGSAGVMVVGSHAYNGENDVYIGGGPWEINAATTIKFLTHTTNFSTNGGTERMRINAAGNIQVSSHTGSTIGYGLQISPQGGYAQIYMEADTTTTRYIQRFYNPAGNVGNISIAGTSTSYSTSSDYRLKENVVKMTGALDRVSQLKPSRFNFIADADTTVDGFLAHEVQEIVPEAITGQKDAVDENGNPEYQGIDQSKLVPLLVAAIQELEARIKELENK